MKLFGYFLNIFKIKIKGKIYEYFYYLSVLFNYYHNEGVEMDASIRCPNNAIGK